MYNKWNDVKGKIDSQSPLIHCITSPIAINDCANAVLALGAKPIMAEHPLEVENITLMSKSLAVSLANITDARAESIMISGKAACKAGISSVIDLVGVTCSKMRADLAKKYITQCRPAVIKGNVSEIKAVCGMGFDASSGIDVSDKDKVDSANPKSIEEMSYIVKNYAAANGCVVMASGETDIISDAKEVYHISNGSSRMADVTGTGCILNCITAVFMSVTDALTACVLAAAVLGISGELADDSRGLGTYHIGLIDSLSLMDSEKFSQMAKIKKYNK